MLEGVMSLASYGLGTGGVAGDLLFQLEQNGVFAYVLPFLMIFAIIFGLLSKMNIFGSKDEKGVFQPNKGINIVLSLAVALMALQLNFVSYFFREIFPRLGVVMSILLTTMIVLGFFIDFKTKAAKKILAPIFFIAVIVIVVQSFSGLWWTSGIGANWGIAYILERNLSWLLPAIFVAVCIYAIAKHKKTDKEKADAKTKRKERIDAAKKYYEDMLVAEGK